VLVENADEIIDMNEKMSPALAVRKKKNSSMNVALQLVKEKKAIACVSAGNTGALMSASLLKLGRIKGVLRPAITTIFPNKTGNMVVLDVGANSDCKAEYLEQFAVMGSIYSENVLGKTNPKVALLNIGEEEGKGNELMAKSYGILKSNSKINFVGNIEPNEMFNGEVDVIVTDGFTGNIVLKTGEGIVQFIFDTLKSSINESLLNKIAALMLKPVFKKMKKDIDASEYGGALFLGLEGMSLKAHGGSDSKAIKNGIKAAHKLAENNFIESLKNEMKGEA